MCKFPAQGAIPIRQMQYALQAPADCSNNTMQRRCLMLRLRIMAMPGMRTTFKTCSGQSDQPRKEVPVTICIIQTQQDNLSAAMNTALHASAVARSQTLVACISGRAGSDQRRCTCNPLCYGCAARQRRCPSASRHEWLDCIDVTASLGPGLACRWAPPMREDAL